MANMKQTKVLEFKLYAGTSDESKYEVHLLNPGEWFQNFGGSRHALQAKKTASLIVRRTSPHGLTDIEYDLRDESVWEWLNWLMKQPEIITLADLKGENIVSTEG